MRTIKQIIPRLALTLVLVTGIGLLFPMSASADDILDQSQPISQSPSNVGDYDYQRAQIFTAGMYGVLDRVSLRLENWPNNPAGATLNVSIQTVIDGLPSGQQIGSGRIELSALPYSGSGGDWVDITIYGAILHAGTQYALVIQTSAWNAEVDWWYAFQNQYGSSYTRGVTARNFGDGWSTDATFDFAFKTYVIPDVLDQEQPRNTAGVVKGSTLGQLFYAGVTGVMDRASAYLGKTTSPLEVTIETVAGGYPSGTVIGRGSIPAGPDSMGFYTTWFTFPINDAVLTAGTEYAMVIRQSSGVFTWYSLGGLPYFNAPMVVKTATGWKLATDDYYGSERYAMFRTYMVPNIALTPPPPPGPLGTITPCSDGVCPAAAGNITPRDSTARITSNIQFQELPDGTIDGVLNFNDSRTGDFVLRGCTTDSAACLVTVTTFECTDQHSITVAGTYTKRGGTATEFLLTLSGVRSGAGSFTLTSGDYTYTLSHMGIVDVTCPPAAGVMFWARTAGPQN
jgi:hypothetical protein